MIQFNLLPEVKLNYLKAKRNRRVVTILSSIVIMVCLFVVGILFMTVNVLQANRIDDIDEKITSAEKSIKDIENIDRILTVQNQLFSVDGLHDEKAVISRLFNYLETIIPSNVRINSLELNTANSTLGITGQTESFTEINRFVDTLKFTDYVIIEDETADGADAIAEDEDSEPVPERAFESVVLVGFGQNQEDVSFSIEIVFDSIIFESQDDIALSVQSQITTRSELSRPDELFAMPEEEDEEL